MALSIGPLEPVNDDDILIVYGFHQARIYPEFNRNNVYTLHGVAAFGRLRGRQPKRVFHTGLGLSREADRLRRELRMLELKYGTKVHHVNELYMYDEGGIAHPDTAPQIQEVPAP
ncbi:hypothetical protein KGG85_gp55 [Streptomyces phage Tefunt]|uniref:Uncharacterized protein n=1 Tax=Streptomyces phage Tefunt TaxID=2041209 RepID=A0A291LIN9_9CAUD|nr:hypothetical protein KGG85_gp55 [Streptomyces phage Tefunt]ATI18995.1 hypothetical protein SEA_TEFUNT_55 [Streptomyces phage Tefunt]